MEPPVSQVSRDQSGFVLVEHMIAAGIIVVFALSALAALVHANRFATASRLQAIALAVAQQRVDETLTTPWNSSTGRPAVLATGSRTEVDLPLSNDSLASAAAGTLSAFSNLDVQVNATRTTQVTDVTTRQVRVSVGVTYSYRSRNYFVNLTTLRAIDSI
jgi:Tfp pilus assembly protein PilV